MCGVVEYSANENVTPVYYPRVTGTTPTAFLPSGGPKTPLRRLSSLDMMMFCVWLALVCAEKLRMFGLYTSLSSLFSRKSCNKHNALFNQAHQRYVQGNTSRFVTFLFNDISDPQKGLYVSCRQGTVTIDYYFLIKSIKLTSMSPQNRRFRGSTNYCP